MAKGAQTVKKWYLFAVHGQQSALQQEDFAILAHSSHIFSHTIVILYVTHGHLYCTSIAFLLFHVFEKTSKNTQQKIRETHCESPVAENFRVKLECRGKGIPCCGMTHHCNPLMSLLGNMLQSCRRIGFYNTVRDLLTSRGFHTVAGGFFDAGPVSCL